MDDREIDYRLGRLVRAAIECEAVLHAAAAAVRAEEVCLVLLERAAGFGSAAKTVRELARSRGLLPPFTVGRPLIDRGESSSVDDATILTRCERCEDLTAAAFRDLLDLPLPATMRAALEPEFDRLLGRLGRLRALRERADRRHERAPAHRV
jgi:hypothetical protein